MVEIIRGGTITAPIFALYINRRIHKIHIPLVQLLPQPLQALTEPLEVDDLPFPQEADHVIHIRVVAQPQDIVVGHPGLLFRRQILRQVSNGVAFDGHGPGIPWESRRSRRVDPNRVVYKVRRKGRILVLFIL